MMRKEFIQLSIPNILTNLTVPLVSLVDVALMGRMPSVNYIVAIGLATTLFSMVYFTFSFLRMGTTGLVSQAFGREDQAGMRLLLIRGLIVSLAISAVLIGLKDQLIGLGLYFFEVDSSTSSLIQEYFQIRIWAAPATISLFVITGWLMGVQNARLTLLLAIIINTANIVISYILVWQFNWEMAGVAYGTLASQYIGLIAAIVILRVKYRISFPREILKDALQKSGWGEFFTVSRDIFIRTLCLLFALSFFKIESVNFDEAIGAVNLLLLEFFIISAFGIDGLAFAAESLSGKYFGKNNLTQLREAVRISLKYGLLLGLLISFVFYFFGANILRMLTDKEDVIELAITYLPWMVIAPLINSLAFIWDGVYIGCTATQPMKWTLLISTFIIFLPGFYLLQNAWGNHGIWLAMTLFMLARGVLQTFWAKKYIYGRVSAN